MDEIWILGATGRTGRAIAERLAAADGGAATVLVGRDRQRLEALAPRAGDRARIVVADGLEAVAARIAADRPAVVINTIGPFAETAAPIVRACPPGTHYLDLSNELDSIRELLALDEQARRAGSTLVPGAGFGVLATESVVLKLCEGERRAPARVRVDALAAVAGEPGRVGSALAASLVGGLAAGGRRYRGGRLVRSPLGGDFERFALPDGSPVHTGSAGSGDLEAARSASGAPEVVAAMGFVPRRRAVRAALPPLGRLLSVPAVARFATRRLAAVTTQAREPNREFSWARARIEYADGRSRTGWLRAGEGMEFTSAVAAGTALRLARGEGRPGAYTPGRLFGPGLAEAAGGRFLLGDGIRGAEASAEAAAGAGADTGAGASPAS